MQLKVISKRQLQLKGFDTRSKIKGIFEQSQLWSLPPRNTVKLMLESFVILQLSCMDRYTNKGHGIREAYIMSSFYKNRG